MSEILPTRGLLPEERASSPHKGGLPVPLPAASRSQCPPTTARGDSTPSLGAAPGALCPVLGYHAKLRAIPAHRHRALGSLFPPHCTCSGLIFRTSTCYGTVHCASGGRACEHQGAGSPRLHIQRCKAPKIHVVFLAEP